MNKAANKHTTEHADVHAYIAETTTPTHCTSEDVLADVVAFQHRLGSVAEQLARESRLLSVARTMDTIGAVAMHAEPASQTLKALRRLSAELDDKLHELVHGLRQLEQTRTEMRNQVTNNEYGVTLDAAAAAS